MPSSRFAGQRVHFIGIAGCGMAGLAGILLDAGAIVTGSDPTPNDQSLDLARRGARISRDQLGELLTRDVDLVVRTAAIPENNPEYLAARRLGISTIKYAQLLGLIMAERLGIAISGTHGKTTTTAMIAHALRTCGADPSFVIGGTVPQLGGSACSGKGNAFVVEACEYDRSFHNLHPAVTLITNIEADHLDCYGTLDNIIDAFARFAALTPPTGVVIANRQDRNVARAIKEHGAVPPDQKIEWIEVLEHPADNAPADADTWRTIASPAENGCYRGIVSRGPRPVAQFKLRIPGLHNAFNATFAIAACNAAGVEPQKAADAISTFRGVDRRAMRIGHFKGADVVDDYGHHPTEIQATLKALRRQYNPKRFICVFQPHQHSRTRTLMDQFATCFGDADLVLIPDIYAVRDSEEEKRLTSSKDLVERIVAAGTQALYIPTFGQIVDYLDDNAREGDLILTIGAGPVCDIARDLVRLEQEQRRLNARR